LAKLFDADLDNLDHLPKQKYQLFEEVSPLAHLTKDGAPALLIYPTTMDDTGIHSPRFGKALKEKMDPLGIECQVLTGVKPGSEKWVKPAMDFIKKHLGIK
jgi:hypothetical protein